MQESDHHIYSMSIAQHIVVLLYSEAKTHGRFLKFPYKI